MSDNFLGDLKKAFKIRDDIGFEFMELYGLTFVFKRKIVIIRDEISSTEINPVGIIYREKGEYCFAPLDVNPDIGKIAEEYVKNCIQM